MLVDTSATDAAAGVSGALRGVAETLTSGVMASDRRFLVDCLRKLTGVEEPERADQCGE